MDQLQTQLAKLRAIGEMLISPGSAFSIWSLAAAFMIGFAFLALRRRERRGRADLKIIARAVFSLRLLKSRSTRGDIFYFFVNTLALGGLIGWGLITGDAVYEFVLKGLDAGLGRRVAIAADGWGARIAATLLLFLAYEFAYWLDHFLKHRIPALWEVHKTHHTAEVLTPLTSFRVHPLDSLVFANVMAVSLGSVLGLIAHFAGTKIADFTVDGTNIFLVLFIFLTVHLQHSQFWIPFSGRLGRLLLSPAHHQIHHSVDPAHYNSNFGSTIAIFDRAFGTLILPPEKNPHLRFGVLEDVKDPHGLTELLVTPVGQCFARLVEATGFRRPAPAPAEVQIYKN
jgi:sterol desaturase/sphingolipid hydroxylase (fatty acid hydroxylase superfamily)